MAGRSKRAVKQEEWGGDGDSSQPPWLPTILGVVSRGWVVSSASRVSTVASVVATKASIHLAPFCAGCLRKCKCGVLADCLSVHAHRPCHCHCHCHPHLPCLPLLCTHPHLFNPNTIVSPSFSHRTSCCLTSVRDSTTHDPSHAPRTSCLHIQPPAPQCYSAEPDVSDRSNTHARTSDTGCPVIRNLRWLLLPATGRMTFRPQELLLPSHHRTTTRNPRRPFHQRCQRPLFQAWPSTSPSNRGPQYRHSLRPMAML